MLFDGPVDAVPEEVAIELLAILREALVNTARHANASRVDVEVATNGEVVLRVTDDRRGLPDEAARASRLAGVMHATPGRGSGTVIEWRVPTSPSS